MNQISAQNTNNRTKHPGGRPPIYSNTLKKAIVEDIAATDLTIAEIAAKYKTSAESIRRWRHADAQFCADCTRALGTRLAHQIMDSEDRDKAVKTELQSNDPKIANALASVHKLAEDRRKWAMERLVEAYATRTQLTGADGGAVQVTLSYGGNKTAASRKSVSKSPVKQSLTPSAKQNRPKR